MAGWLTSYQSGGGCKCLKGKTGITGISVYWLFFGKTALPQTELSKEELSNLKAVWKAIVEAAGGKLIFADDPVKNSSPTDLPAVTIVETGEKELGINYAENVIEKPMETIVLSETELRFYGDSTKLIDEDAARNSLRTVAEHLKSASAASELNHQLMQEFSRDDKNSLVTENDLQDTDRNIISDFTIAEKNAV